MRHTILFIALMLSLGLSIMANIADPSLPGRLKSLDTSLSIRIDKNAQEAKLIIPKAQLKQLRAELEHLDSGGAADDIAAASSVTRTQTIVSGGLLSLAFVFGGMWFVRSGSRNSKFIAGAAVLLVFSSIANLVYANAGPPPETRAISGKLFTREVHMYKQAWGRIKLEVSDKVRNPELIVPEKAVERAE